VRLPSQTDVAAAKKTLASAVKEGDPPQYRDRDAIYARETVLLSESYPKTARTPVQALRIGNMAIATFPGEAFVELGLEVKAKSPFKPTFLIELANDYRGYLPTVEGHELGGYETWRAKSSYLEKEAAPKMVASAIRQLEKLA
jgi:neutral ceramidase